MKALVGAFNQEKALEGAFSVTVQLNRLIDLRHYHLLCGRAGAAVLGAVRPVPVRAGHLLEHHRGLQLQVAGGGHRAAPQLLLQAKLHRAGRHVQLPGGPLHQVG